MTDLEVMQYIESEFPANPVSSHTTLLRKLRSQGQACEQKRFRDIFLAVRGAMA
jgi:hypothetical protein